MGVLIITTGTEADTLFIKEVAERFGCQVALRFGSYYFRDDVVGNSKVVSATGEIEAEQINHQKGEESHRTGSLKNKSLSRHLEKFKR